MCGNLLHLAADGLISVFLAACPPPDWSGDLLGHMARARDEAPPPSACGPDCTQVPGRESGPASQAITVFDLRQFSRPAAPDDDEGDVQAAPAQERTQLLLRRKTGGNGDLQGEIIILLPASPRRDGEP